MLNTVINMISENPKVVSPAYSSLFGKSVVLLVVIRQCYVLVPCSIIGESASDVRVRLQSGWEMEGRKELILPIEEDVAALTSRVRHN